MRLAAAVVYVWSEGKGGIIGDGCRSQETLCVVGAGGRVPESQGVGYIVGALVGAAVDVWAFGFQVEVSDAASMCTCSRASWSARYSTAREGQEG